MDVTETKKSDGRDMPPANLSLRTCCFPRQDTSDDHAQCDFHTIQHWETDIAESDCATLDNLVVYVGAMSSWNSSRGDNRRFTASIGRRVGRSASRVPVGPSGVRRSECRPERQDTWPDSV